MSLPTWQESGDDDGVETDVNGEELGQASGAPHEGSGRDLRPAQRTWSVDRALVQSEVTRAVTLMEAVGRTEKDLADTLRAVAGAGRSESAPRRLRLAEAAIRGAHEAVERGEQLQQLADWWSRHADVAALHQLVEHAGRVLADLAATEENIAILLTRLASEGGRDLADERGRLADEALESAQRARDRAQALRKLAETGVARAEIPVSAVAERGAGQ